MPPKYIRPALFLAAIVPLAFLAANAAAKTVYVDFAAGADTNGGVTADHSLKHCPGDSGAQANAKTLSLQPGDTVLFKGGVTYRGNIVVPASGDEKQPITFDGNSQHTFGKGPAILDGSIPVTDWKPCASASECSDNPHWKSIYHVSVDLPAEPFTSNMYQGDKMLWLAQEPNPKDPFYQDIPTGHRKITEATATTITDPAFFTQPDAHAWDDAWLVVYASPNYPYFVKITGYDPATHQVTHASKLTKPSSYAVLNSLLALDTPGEYVVRPGRDGKGTEIFLWPLDAKALEKSGVSISTGGTAFDINAKQHIVIRGFIMQKFTASKLGAMGVQISKSEDVTVTGNEIRFGNHNRTGSIAHGAGIDVTGSNNIVLENNKIVDNRRCSGIISNPATHVVVRDNTVSKTGYVGIWFMKTTDSQIVDNTVTDNHGVHSNAISIYTHCSHILVADNKVFRCERPLTLQDSPDLYIVNNVLISDGGPALGLWSGDPIQKISVVNNLILNQQNGDGVYSVSKIIKDCVFENNIMGNFQGEAAIDNQANQFVSNIYLSPNQHLFNSTDKHAAAADLFVDPGKEDYHLKPGSSAIAAGTPPSYPTAAWPHFDFTKDVAGRPRSAGKTIDVGPYEHP